MPGKPRHGKGKRPSLDRKRKDRQRSPATATQQPVTAQTSKPAFPADKMTPRTSVRAPVTPVTAHFPYIRTELLRIGILTGIILVILFTLALVSAKF